MQTRVLLLALLAVSGQALQERRKYRPTLEGCEGVECLKRFVALPDASFAWTSTGHSFEGVSSAGESYVGHLINVTSQTWEPTPDAGRFVWWHPLVVIVPATLDLVHAKDFGIVYIGGTQVKNAALHEPEGVFKAEEVTHGIQLALQARAVVAVLLQVPSQALVFADDPAKTMRTEDAVKAYTWRHYMDSGRPGWPLELPMVKAVVRAMDTLSQLSSSEASPLPAELHLERFGLIGLSKRGMAALQTAAIDARVKAIVPVVISIDTDRLMHRLIRSLGNPPAALYNYRNEEVFAREGSLEMQRMYAIIDPVNYMQLLSVPKLLLHAGNDDFFPVDASRSWFAELPGDKAFRMVPNSRHMMDVSEFAPSAASFFRSFLLKTEAPKIEWTADDDRGTVHVRQLTHHVPLAVRAWRAFSCDEATRDFRWDPTNPTMRSKCGTWDQATQAWVNERTAWHAGPAAATGNRSWSASVGALPSGSGWGAVMIELEFPGPDAAGPTVRLTSEVVVAPSTYPYPDCHGRACQGTGLVLQQVLANASATSEVSWRQAVALSLQRAADPALC